MTVFVWMRNGDWFESDEPWELDRTMALVKLKSVRHCERITGTVIGKYDEAYVPLAETKFISVEND